MLCTDDRGKRVRIIPAYQLDGLGTLWCPLPRDVRLMVRAHLREGGYREYYVPMAVWMVLAFGSLILWLPSYSRFASGLQSIGWLAGVLPGLLIPLSMIPFGYWACWKMRMRMARLVLAEGHCATCGYALDGIESESDRCTICPECGSAWRIPAPKNA